MHFCTILLCKAFLSDCPVDIHLFQLRFPWTMFHSLRCIMVNPFVAGSSVLFTFIKIIMENICEKAFKSFQVKWLLKFLSMNQSHGKKLEASSFNNIKWIWFYRLIKLRFCMARNKANQRWSSDYYYYYYSVLKKLPQVKLFIVVQQTP